MYFCLSNTKNNILISLLDRLKIQSENGIGHKMLPQFMENGSRASSELKMEVKV